MILKGLTDDEKEWYLTLFLTLLVLTSMFALTIPRLTILTLPEASYDAETKVVNLTEWTLKQKIGQMTMVLAKNDNGDFYKKLNVGGVFMGAKETSWGFIGNTKLYQTNFTVVPLFITTDLEGCTNPFEAFQQFPASKDIETEDRAYELGLEHGSLLKKLGFNMNFAPVVDLEDNIWDCRAFPGTSEEIARKSVAYVRGLNEHEILATVKHYPGKTMEVNDPHTDQSFAEINEDDLYPFEVNMKNNVDAVMLNHLVVSGVVNSGSKPTVVSETITQNLRQQYSGLIITDEIHMMGLKKFYSDKDQMFVDLFKANNDIVLNLNKEIEDIYQMICAVEKAVKKGEISEERIDESVTRILETKGIAVVY